MAFQLHPVFRVFCLLAFSAGLVSGCKKQGGEAANSAEVVIGEYGSLTGTEAAFGQSTHEGIVLAVEQANAGGGVVGKKIRLQTEDDAGDQDQALAVVKKLINRDNVCAVLGEVASTNSLAGGGVCQSSKIPMVTPSSTNPKVTQGKDYVFRVCFTDDFQGRVNAREAIRRGYKRVAIFTAIDSDYSKGLSNYFQELFSKSGQIVVTETYGSRDRDFKPQLSQILTSNPDAVYLPGYYTQIGEIVTQARELGLKVPFFGGDGWDGPNVFAMGATADGCWFTDHYSPDEQRPEVLKFVKDYKDRWNGKVPDAMAVTGYDAANVLIGAIAKAGKADPTAIRDALTQIKDFPGASGTITIDANRNASKPIVVLELHGGKAVLQPPTDATKPEQAPTAP